jgi:hypothetical protein
MAFLSKDIWRVIGSHLTKRDLISVQLSDDALARYLDGIPEIWHGKHLPDYGMYIQEKYGSLPISDRDIDIKKQIDVLRNNDSGCPEYCECSTTKCETYAMFQKPGEDIYPKLVRPQYNFVYHQDVIHPEGECHLCDYEVHERKNVLANTQYNKCPECFGK